ncbi:luciferin 4-monooxygenase-like [Ctenocephalides felis]|uniref:luciferin 4-monooxygenase-like n=1 Tax=Ctenocephalides felis TaxID=7515 RepID=UPI000E6E194A|nr:luciferin 4-monooxygenase-like [Ctenocephalides felis]
MTVFTNSGMSWGSGLFILISGLIGGARRAFTKEPFNEENLLRIMREYKPGLMLLSSYQLSLMNLYLQDKEDLAEPFGDVMLLFAVGSKLSPQQVETMQKHLKNGKLVVSYGLTECMGGTTTITCAEYRPGTVGHVLMNTELKIVDTSTGETLGPNRQGEMYLRGPTMLGYYGRPEATSEVLDPETGWFKTGDIGYYDEDHYVYVTDRIKEIAKYKGIYINPSDIEIVISRHPSVRSCAVVSVPNDEVCDLMVGFVELLPDYKDKVTAQELEIYTNENVQDYEKLRGGLYILDELPVLTHGKIAKALLKQKAKEMLNEIMSKFNNKLLSRM